MNKKIHPKWHDDCHVSCVCGNSFITGSTLPKIKVQICSACHPFFTGEMKYVDALGRVERFKQKQAAAKKGKYISKTQRKKLAKKAEGKEDTKPRTLKEMLTKQ